MHIYITYLDLGGVVLLHGVDAAEQTHPRLSVLSRHWYCGGHFEPVQQLPVLRAPQPAHVPAAAPEGGGGRGGVVEEGRRVGQLARQELTVRRPRVHSATTTTSTSTGSNASTSGGGGEEGGGRLGHDHWWRVASYCCSLYRLLRFVAPDRLVVGHRRAAVTIAIAIATFGDAPGRTEGDLRLSERGKTQFYLPLLRW